MVTGTYLLILPLGWALIRGWVFIRTNTVESVLLSRFGPRYFLLKSSGQGQHNPGLVRNVNSDMRA